MDRLAWIEILDRHGGVASRHPVHAWPARIGRGYDCDIVLDDPYVAASHLEIRPSEDGGYELVATGTRNGLRLGGRRARQDSATVSTHELVRIGQTQLRIRPVDFPVPAEEPLPRHAWLQGWTGLLVAVLVFAFVKLLTQWLEYDRAEGYDILVAPLFVGIPGFLLWVGAWSLIGRVVRGHANVMAHAVVVLLGSALVLLLGFFVIGYLEFAFDSRMLSDVLSAIAFLVIPGGILYFHLRLVSRVGRRKLGLIVASLMAVLAGLFYLDDLWSQDKHLTRMSYAETIGPNALLLVRAQSPDEFLADARRLQRKLDPARSEDLSEP